MDYKRVSRCANMSGSMGYNGPYGSPRQTAAATQMQNVGCGQVGVTGVNKVQEKSLAMVYAPYQYFEDLYSPENGFYAGTIFVKLDMPCTACTACRVRR